MNLEIPASVKFALLFVHPILMSALLLLSIYAAYLGLQVQRTRSAEGEQKKELVKGRYNVKHYQIGSVILALMVLSALGAIAITYLSDGKLYVGTHLIGGLGMLGLVAISASLAPFMQKGANWARVTHISLNFVLLGLFAVLAFTGVEIVIEIVAHA
ncbi:DUF4079 domain-containing protein [Aetokthonos hydrillicola Thurmond2011]|jgi:hypothetical protein|uniref:DUF4079 domain-containing protein n=1 Tax=Aetokthonos hydrillicola Thurmond2011 TaxID=2712845 RepID=A0AAP5I216_9CYAN|nr:DUF4079 domain-containing protein [Aetokthonos hydrillicola]MBO3462279.1 DUF4079 domain-containing protein [Aetokthonos hydrillicola CCALA 1050]MBW4589478.1 DUF4079 domain-containing protein [Aetokthonos hydrillicola CCALA 1050]MDR9893678.1 DUF4079 domain-containing protein [Aetokthonos hydrillicola Thurmond2011]